MTYLFVHFFVASPVKEDAKGYPQPTTWKVLPASGLYIRHADGISIHNVVLGVENPDVRVPVMANDVSNLQIAGIRLSGPFKSIPLIKGKNLKVYEVEKPLGWKGQRNGWIEMIGD